MRNDNRKNNQLRNVSIETNINIHSDGSCLIKCGNTHIICTATIDENVPRWMRNTNKGWVTAEYGMLPGSTNSRIRREAASGKQSGRTQEIQRLIGRSLRSVVDLGRLGERQIIVDCDVIQADGGTRTASITGGYVALSLAINKLTKERRIAKSPIICDMAAVSCGIYNDEVILDLDYLEDSNAEADANFVMTSEGKIIEVQATAEEFPFTQDQFSKMMQYSMGGISELIKIQKQAIQC